MKYVPIIVVVDFDLSQLDVDCYINYTKKKIKQTYSSVKRGHGSGVCNVIKRHNKDIKLIGINVGDSIKDGDINTIIDILTYIYNNIKCDIINISMSCNFVENNNTIDKLYKICEMLSNESVTIIAAFDNGGSISYPAALSNVIGVVSDDLCVRKSDIIYYGDDVVNIGANGKNQTIIQGNQYLCLSGTSYACAHVSGVLSTVMVKKTHYKEILEILKNIAIKKQVVNDNLFHNDDIPKIKKAVIFPFNKEMQTLIRYSDMIDFEIINIYDYKYSTNLGQITNDFLDVDSRLNYHIKNLNDINYEEFDTLILGHTESLKKHSAKIKNQIDSVIDKCVLLGKNIYSLDLLPNIKYEKLFVPQKSKELIYYAPLGKLHVIAKPIIGVWGTSSNQGKFSLQLMLRKSFIKNGYKIGQIGTEPTAYLFGMDDCFHFGYNSKCEITRFDAIAYINYSLYEITKKNVDVILVGCQSRTIPVDYYNLNNYTLAQMEFLLATRPDLIILTVNVWDDIDYIVNTVKFLESSINSLVCAVVVYPYEFKKGDHHNNIKEKLSSSTYLKFKIMLSAKIRLPIFRLDKSNDMEALYKLIVKKLT